MRFLRNVDITLAVLVLVLALMLSLTGCSTSQLSSNATRDTYCQNAKLGLQIGYTGLRLTTDPETSQYWEKWLIGAKSVLDIYCK